MSASILAQKIINAQLLILGPLALEQAKKVDGLILDSSNKVSIDGNEKTVLESLVKNYEHLLGQTSVAVCKNAIKDDLQDYPKEQLPEVLQ